MNTGGPQAWIPVGACFGLLACSPARPVLPAPSLVVDEDIGSVVLASWPMLPGPRTRVVIEDEDGPWLVSDWQEGADGLGPEGQHTVTLLGLWTDRDWLAHVEDEDGARSADQAFRTTTAPGSIPRLQLTGQPEWEGYLFTAILGGVSAAVVLDEAGELVWWHEIDIHYRPLRVRERLDRAGLWLGAERDWPETGGELVSVSWTGDRIEAYAVQPFSHDFVERGDGRLAWLEYEARKVPGHEVEAIGGRLVEGSPGGQHRVVWSTWDSWVPYQDAPVAADGYWAGLNALDLDEVKGTYTVGSRGLDAIVELDAATGEVLRQVGGPQSSYSFAEPADASDNQHQFQWTDDGILIFDNRDATQGSRIVELALDEATASAAARFEMSPEPSLFVYALGDVDRADDGRMLVTWSAAGRIDDLAADGGIRASYGLDVGYAFGFAQRVAALPGVQRVR